MEIDILLVAINSAKPAVKYGAMKRLRDISRENPAALYPEFAVFAKLLDSPANIIKWNAIDIVAGLTAADTADKFSPLFTKYYALLAAGSLITAGHVVESSPVIVKNRPVLESKITARLLTADRLPLPTPECRDILCGKVIIAFAQYAATSTHQAEMRAFAEKLVNQAVIRPATKKKAELFIKKFPY
jgi:hypothetical protein